MKFKNKALATITVTLLVATPGWTTPRPDGNGQAQAVNVHNGEQVSQALSASGLDVQNVDGAKLYEAMQTGKITQEALQRFLDPELSDEFKPLCSQIIQATVNLESGLNTNRFSTPTSEAGSNVQDSLGRITELTIQKINGQQTEISTAKMMAVSEVINTYAQSAKSEVDADVAKNSAREILNRGNEEPVVTPEQDPFDVIKNCR